MNNLEECKADNPQHLQQEEMAASAAAMDGMAASALRSVLQRVHQTAERCGRESQRIRVVAVSKTKPVSVIRQVFDAGHRCFGENYVQEIVEKAPQVKASNLSNFSYIKGLFFILKIKHQSNKIVLPTIAASG